MKRALFYGDSNTYGYDPAGFMGGRYTEQHRWTAILARSLAGEWEIADDGMPGRMIPGNNYGMWITLDAVMAQGQPDLFAVMLGTNDLLVKRYPDSFSVALKMKNFLTYAQSRLSGKILLIAPVQIRFTDPSCTEPFVQGSGAYEKVCGEESIRLAQYYMELAAHRGLFFADASSWDLELAFDGVHLSEKGHHVFAAEIEKVMRKIAKEM